MHTVISRLLLLMALVTVASPAMADSSKYSGELIDSLARVTSTDRIPVWIELEKRSALANLKAEVASSGTTRQERYAAAYTKIRTANEAAQASIMRDMRAKMASADAAKIKTHWLVNVLEAELTPAELEQFSNRADVTTINLAPHIVSIDPVVEDEGTSSAATVESNLTHINADDAWHAGYTGAGRLICSFDTGIRGTHSAIKNNWKGNDGDSAAAWFDPVYKQKAPHVISSSTHGTHVMGILCGHNDATGDTIGVALNAKWISAAVVDVYGSSIIDAFEWAADPDGDPNTINDVPDVINHSWGAYGVGCTDLFYDLIDYTEALGIVNIFAAGNDGSANTSIRNPANRANDSLDCFAVGNLVHTGDSINTSSSRGPSNCNVGARKPNVVAPGTTIRSAYSTSDNTYGNLSGTSMATPHVAGLVALLRQKNPNATVDDIKRAILTTTRTTVKIVPGNAYGWGEIDCMAALNALAGPSGPALKVAGFSHVASTINAGDTVRGVVTLINAGTNATGVTLMISGTNPSLTVLSGSASFGSITAGSTKVSTDSIRIVVSDTVTEGSILPIAVTLTANAGYSKATQLAVIVGQVPGRTYVTHNSGLVDFTVSNFGAFGLAPNSYYPIDGAGFDYKSGGNDMYEGGLMLCDGAGHVSDCVRNLAQEWDGDFRVMPGGALALAAPGAHAPQETFARMSDDRAEHPIGVELTQETFSFNGSVDHDFIIFRYILKNQTAATLNNLCLGLYADWDLPANGYSTDAGGWDAINEYLWAASYPSGDSVMHRPRAIVVLQGNTYTAHTGPGADVAQSSGNFTEAEKYEKMQSRFSTATTYASSRNDIYQILAAGPISLPVGVVDTIAFAIVAADTITNLPTAVDHARSTYYDMIGSCCLGIRGNVDADANDQINIMDILYLAFRLYNNGLPPDCPIEANANGDVDETVDMQDLVYLINYCFLGGPAPSACP